MVSTESAQAISVPNTQGRNLSVIGLSAASLVDQGEEQALPILWSYMYASLGASIGQLGTVLGASRLAMTLMYPAWGYAADRFPRRMLLVWFTGFWGLWTLGIGFADSLSQLLILRVITGLGLGVFAPAAFTLIGDLFDNGSRGRAVGGIRAAGLLGTIFAVGFFPALASGDQDGWRICFIVMGSASMITGLLLLLIREPARGASEPELRDVITDQAATRNSTAWADLSALFKIRSWRYLLVNELLTKPSIAVFVGWNFTFLTGLGLEPPVFYGTILLIFIGMTTGSIFFGWLGDRLDERYPGRGRVLLIQAGLVVSLPGLVGYLLSTGENIAWLVCFAFLGGISNCAFSEGTLWPVAQAVLPPELRGSSRAILSMLAGGVSALMLALSGVAVDRMGISASMLVFVPVPILLSIVAWLPIFRTYPGDRAALHDLLIKQRADLLR